MSTTKVTQHTISGMTVFKQSPQINSETLMKRKERNSLFQREEWLHTAEHRTFNSGKVM